MIELILSAIGLGFMLSLVLIGPVFFLLIETSLSKGPKVALVLDAGVIVADLICILVAHYGSKDALLIIDKYPGFYKITAFILLIYGLYMFLSKTKTHVTTENKLASKNYIRTFFNGFILNIVNVGVVVFWIITVISIRAKYPNLDDFFIYITVVIATFLGIDLLKIYLARSFHSRATTESINLIRKIVGILIIGFGIFIFIKSLGYFKGIDKELEKRTKLEHIKQG